MLKSSASTVQDVAGMQQLLDHVGRRIRRLGLSVSLWDAAGTLQVAPQPIGEFCQQFCAEKEYCLEAMGQAAQRACLEDGPVIDQAPNGCWLLGVRLRRRRRLMGAVVACFPAQQTAESEDFLRACSQAGLDGRLMATLCRRDAQYDARQAENLCRTLTWLIEDEQAKTVAQGELETLSANLSSTYEELALLYRISGEMKVNQSAREFFERVCRELLEVVHIQAAGAVFCSRPYGDGGEEVVLTGDSPVTQAQLSHLVERLIQPRMAAEPRPVVENQFAASAARAGVSAGDVRTLVAIPLMSAEAYKGVLVGMNKIGGDGEFDTVDMKLISSIGGQAAVFLANHHLYGDLQDLLMGMLHALTASIDAKDPYTCGHSRRVALISRKLAELSGLDEQRVGRLYLAGLLHDVGKIGMPESVLLKKGKLTDQEFEKVRQHPLTGGTILGGIRQIEDALPAIIHHHERPDGRGYPDRLRRGEISEEALIVGLADSFDAMTSDRTYRPAMPLEAVIAEIRRCSGTQFDVRLVERLLGLDLEAFLMELRQESADETYAGVTR